MNVFRSAMRVIFLFLLMFMTSPASSAGPEISWQVKNRFRMFDYLTVEGQKNASTSAALFQRFEPRADETSASWIKRIIAAGGSPYAAGQKGAWLEDHRGNKPRYADDFTDAPAFFAIKARLTHAGIETQLPAEARCAWRLDGKVIADDLCSKEIEWDALSANGGVLSVHRDGVLVTQEKLLPNVKIVLGLGDSYAAGEGSPDLPTKWRARPPEDEWPLGDIDKMNEYVDTSADWLSPRCNRSFYSYQNMVALRVAAENPHSTVAFIHLACAGAEIVDGMLAPQRMAPGHANECKNRKDRNVVEPACDTPVSQLTAAVDALCMTKTREVPVAQLERMKGKLVSLAYGKEQITWINELRECPDNQLRPADLVLLSVGGNDMGFSGVIAWGLMPVDGGKKLITKMMLTKYIVRIAREKGGVVCPSSGAKGCAKNKKLTAASRITELPGRFAALDIAFTTLLQASGPVVVANTYTNPLQNAGGTMCGDTPYTNTKNAWYAMRMLIPGIANPAAWQVNLTPSEAGVVNKNVIPRLNATITDAATKAGWRVALVGNAMEGRGWCTGKNVAMLSPADIGQWNPYEDNIRMVRTGVDSLLTQWPGTADRSDGLYGAFHPNAQGYAAISDVVLETLKK